jgi:hypothetical protein
MDNNLAIVQDYLTPCHEVHIDKKGKPRNSVLASITDICNKEALDLDAFPCYADLREGGYTLLNRTDKILRHLGREEDGLTALWPVKESFVYYFPPLVDSVLNRDVHQIYETFSKVFNTQIEYSKSLYTIQHSVFLKATIEYMVQKNTSVILFNQNHSMVNIFSDCFNIAKSHCDVRVYMPKKAISMVTMLGLQNKAVAKYYNLYVVGDISNLKDENYFWSGL